MIAREGLWRYLTFVSFLGLYNIYSCTLGLAKQLGDPVMVDLRCLPD